MIKLNNKGFMLTEVLIVSTLIITVLLIMYTQFKNIKLNFDKGFKYNTVNDLYNLYNVKKYIEDENFIAMTGRLNINDYVRIDNCNPIYYENSTYCKRLYDTINLEELYLVKSNITKLKENKDLNRKTMDFIKTIENSNGDGYRLIGKFEKDRYAVLEVLNGTKFKAQISNSCSTTNKVPYTIYHKKENSNIDIVDPVIEEGYCSKKIIVKDKKIINSCYVPTTYSKVEFILIPDGTQNSATIEYSLLSSRVQINHYQKGTTTILSPANIVNLDCGSKLSVYDYILEISGKTYTGASFSEVVSDGKNKEVNIYYE